MVRSVELHSFYIAYASVTERNGDRLFLRDPANARDVPAGPLVAPPRLSALLTVQLRSGQQVTRYHGPEP